MPRGISLTVAGQRFETKDALIAHVRKLIAGYSVGDFLEPDDQAFCVDLFRFHTEAAAKFGAGIEKVEVRLDPYGKKHFQIYRVDGTDDDISWPHCVRWARGDIHGL